VTTSPVLMTDALDQWCLCKLSGIEWYHNVLNDDARRDTEQPHLLATVTVQAWRPSLFCHSARMSDKSDAKQILTASQTTGTPPYYMNEDYPAGPEINEPLSP